MPFVVVPTRKVRFVRRSLSSSVWDRTCPASGTPTGPEGRQTVAQRVSAGFRPHMKTSPGGATEPLPSHEHRHSIDSPKPENAPEREAGKPQSLEAAKISVVADQEIA
jgi:hypothetical protein